MSLIEIFLIGIGLAMDAFAVSVCKGLSYSESNYSWKKALIPGVYFGAFQALMPIIGFFIGSKLKGAIEAYDHWIAFVLLVYIGFGMFREARGDVEKDPDMSVKTMILLAIATSIDALTVGVTMGIIGVNIWIAALIIGITTFIISTAGFKVGNAFGLKFKSKAEMLGGIILILIGFKILLEHLGIISF